MAEERKEGESREKKFNELECEQMFIYDTWMYAKKYKQFTNKRENTI